MSDITFSIKHYAEYKLLGTSIRVINGKPCPIMKVEETKPVSRSLFEWIFMKPTKYKKKIFSVILHNQEWRDTNSLSRDYSVGMLNELYKMHQLRLNLEDNGQI